MRFQNAAPPFIKFGLHGGLASSAAHGRPLSYEIASAPADQPYPQLKGASGEYARKRCVQIAGSFDRERLKRFNAEILKTLPGDRSQKNKVRAIAEFLRNTYDYTLDLEDPKVELDPVLDFLFQNKRGHCELFASSLIMLLRAEDIPARLVSGFLSNEYSPFTRAYTVRQSHAHAWVEVLFPGIGWVTVDPTPSSEDGSGERWAVAQVWDWLDLKWSRWIMSYGPYDQRNAFTGFAEMIESWVSWLGIRGVAPNPVQTEESSNSGGQGGLLSGIARNPGAGVVIGALAAWLLYARWRRSKGQPSTSPPDTPLERAAVALTSALAGQGRNRRGSESLAALLQRARSDGLLPIELDGLGARYEQLRFGLRPDATRVQSLEQDLIRLSAELSARPISGKFSATT